ncbi:hypothetical protein PUATCC27989T_00457 [Phytobacter ursingii]|nr:hypothetical protein PUATCC27989T_00457 [Phytobacter ursingii]
MKERGMIFNAEMVRAILDGRKTQTRRLVKVDFDISETATTLDWSNALASNHENVTDEDIKQKADSLNGVIHPVINASGHMVAIMCPYGKVGDRIWVRETFGDCGERLVYRADIDDGANCKVKRWTPSIHMPREASRITLEITGVRVERLNYITEEDARSEGTTPEPYAYAPGYEAYTREYRLGYRKLWESIYGEENWNANP